MKKNTIISKKDIFMKSPAIGLREKELKLILGKKLKVDVGINKPMKLKFFR